MGLIVVGGSLMGSRSEAVTSADTVAATAVVVSSPPCPAGSRQTIVDVGTAGNQADGANLVRATLVGCGYQEGMPVAVQYPAGNLTQVTAAPDGDTGTATVALLPLGLTVAGLLTVGAALAVYVDGRRRPLGRRHAAGVDADEQVRDGRYPDDAGLEESGQPPVATHRTSTSRRMTAGVEDMSAVGPATAPDGTALRPFVADGADKQAASSPDGAVLTAPWAFLPINPRSTEFPDRNGHGPFTAALARATATIDHSAPPFTLQLGEAADAAPEAMSSSRTRGTAVTRHEVDGIDTGLPNSSSLAARLHDELFTHRSVSG